MSLLQRKIVLIVSGGIAAYKAADLASRLVRAGVQVRVAMTDSAREFVAPLTFEALTGHPVAGAVLGQPQSFEMEHIGWARWAEAVVVAPATANLIARLAAGLADDAATTLLLAYRGPVWLAPSMNTAMYEHAATQANLRTLAGRGVRLIEPGDGRLACGEVGPGRMAEPVEIVERLEAELGKPSESMNTNTVSWGGRSGVPGAELHAEAQPASPALRHAMAQFSPQAGGRGGVPGAGLARAQTLDGRTVLITAGPTREALDPIRFLSNRSTGRMGAALAAEALARGARVLLLHGPMDAGVPPGAEAVPIESARELLDAVQRHWPQADVAIFAAAVANYAMAAPEAGKLKGGEQLTLELRRTPDVAAWGGANRRPGQFLIGFAAESSDLLGAARRKLAAKQLDLICANPIGEPGVGFAAEQNRITLVDAEGSELALPDASKTALAAHLWDEFERRMAARTLTV
jgi:phosphopantothenoylcysteine decarboxylase/phosphopantothenate--cysteine ligase